MAELPWLVRKIIDFEAWFNVRMLDMSEQESRDRLLAGARMREASDYIWENY